jgi:uncharacterized membrane protein
MSALVHTLHAVLAGAWLGGVIFTTFVVSPALKAMKWGEAERVLVRSNIGKRYAKVGSANLALLAAFAILDGLVNGFGALLYVEYALLLVVAGLVAVHGAYFGKRLAGLAAAEREAPDTGTAAAFAERRRSLQEISLRASQLDLLVSTVVAVLAVNA